jgi:hypothetical protein
MCMYMRIEIEDQYVQDVCHDVSVARIGFQHKPVQREAPRTVRTAIV